MAMAPEMMDATIYDRWVLEGVDRAQSGIAQYIVPAIQAFTTVPGGMLTSAKLKPWNEFTLKEFQTMVASFKVGLDALLKFGETTIANTGEPEGAPSTPTDISHRRNAEYLRVMGAACVYLHEIYKALFRELDGKKSPRVIAHVRDAFRRKLVANPTDPFWMEIRNVGTVISNGGLFTPRSHVVVSFTILSGVVNGFNGAAISDDLLVTLKGRDLADASSVRPVSEMISSEMIAPDHLLVEITAPALVAGGSQTLRGVFA